MFQIDVIPGDFEVELARVSTLESEVSNSANNKGFAYFWAVDQGRGPIRPVNAKALRFRAKDGNIVFSKYAKAAPAQHLTDRSLKRLMPNTMIAAMMASGNSFLSWARDFLRSMARAEANELQGITPRVSGKLAKSYKTNVNG